ncbi:MAG: nitroreductase family protein [Halobacteria archaeon]
MDELIDEVREHREMEYEVDPLFLNRWSPRGMTGELLDEDEYMPLFEAARWAPSSYNNQGWRFFIATRESDDWNEYLDLLVEGNRAWAKDAAVLVVIASKTTFDHNGNPARTHSFDAGAAWENLALEGARRGLVVHGMQGFDYDAARETVELPEEFEVEAMCAIGRRAPRESLSEELREREVPSGRKPLDEIVIEGSY